MSIWEVPGKLVSLDVGESLDVWDVGDMLENVGKSKCIFSISTMFLGFWNDAIGVLAKSKVLPKSKKYWIRKKKIQKIEKNTK